MTTATLRLSTPIPDGAPTRAKKGLLTRLYHAMIEARMRAGDARDRDAPPSDPRGRAARTSATPPQSADAR